MKTWTADKGITIKSPRTCIIKRLKPIWVTKLTMWRTTAFRNIWVKSKEKNRQPTPRDSIKVRSPIIPILKLRSSDKRKLGRLVGDCRNLLYNSIKARTRIISIDHMLSFGTNKKIKSLLIWQDNLKEEPTKN